MTTHSKPNEKTKCVEYNKTMTQEKQMLLQPLCRKKSGEKTKKAKRFTKKVVTKALEVCNEILENRLDNMYMTQLWLITTVRQNNNNNR